MIETFPVQVVSRAEPARNAQGNLCTHNRTWYADWHEALRGDQPHHAQDIFGPADSLVVAPEYATVTDVATTEKGGHTLRLWTRGRTYYMAHLLEPALVSKGTNVQPGQVLARLGRSGNAADNCPHLHISARKTGTENPINIYEELRRVDRGEHATLLAVATQSSFLVAGLAVTLGFAIGATAVLLGRRI